MDAIVRRGAIALAMSLLLTVGLYPAFAFAADGSLRAGASQVVPQSEIDGSTDLGDGYFFYFDGVEYTSFPGYYVDSGQKVTPRISVYYFSLDDKLDKNGYAVLDASKYTIKYSKLNADSGEYEDIDASSLGVGFYKVTASGRNGYSGATDALFEVYDRHNLEGSNVAFDDKYFDKDAYEYVVPAGDKPAVVVTIDGKKVPANSYSVSYQDADLNDVNGFPTRVGRYYAVVEGKDPYFGESYLSFYVVQPIASATVTGVVAKNYAGKPVTQTPVVKVGNTTLRNGTDYQVSYVNNNKVGTATMVVKGKGSYAGTKNVTFKINKGVNPVTVKAKTATVKYSKLKKKAQKLAAGKVVSVTKAQGAVTYKKKSGNKKITIASNGKVTVKKGLKKGTYKVKVAVTAKGNGNYNAATKTITFKVKVK